MGGNCDFLTRIGSCIFVIRLREVAIVNPFPHAISHCWNVSGRQVWCRAKTDEHPRKNRRTKRKKPLIFAEAEAEAEEANEESRNRGRFWAVNRIGVRLRDNFQERNGRSKFQN